MREDKTYWVALFDSVSHVMKAEKILKEANIPYKIVPVPKSISSDCVRILVCGTCVNFFDLGGKIGAGTVSNMYEIAGALSTAGRIVKP